MADLEVAGAAKAALEKLLTDATSHLIPETQTLVLGQADWLLEKHLVNAEVLRATTRDDLIAFGVAPGAVVALKLAFPPLPAGGAAVGGMAAGGLGVSSAGDATDQAVYAQLRPPVSWSSSTVPSAAQFEEALFSRHYQLPVLGYLRRRFPLLAEHLVVTGECDLSVELSHLLSMKVLPGCSEQNSALLVGRYTACLESLARLAKPATTLDISMDVAERVGSGTHPISQTAGGGGAHPDLIVTIHGLSILFGELKIHDMWAAWKDNVDKLRAGFPALFYGRVPFIPLLSATSTSIQFGYLRPDGKVCKLAPVLQLVTPEDRLTAVFAFTNLHHILQHLASLAAPEDERVPLNRIQSRLHGVTVMVNGKTAVKTIPSTVFTNVGTSFAVVKAAHERANSCNSLVSTSALEEEQTTKKRRSDVVILTTNCVVTMTQLGYPKGTLTEAEKKAAVRCCLQAADHLHASRPPLMHCDIRLPNILWGPEPFLSDLEMAHTEPWKVEQSMVHPEQWMNTLDNNGCYTCASDLNQIGIMMENEMGITCGEGWDLATALKNKTITVAAALQHPYLAAPAP